MLTLADVLAPVSGTVSRESGGELVVVLPEQGRYIVLNGTGAEVFRLIDGQRTLGEIAATLVERHAAPLEQVQADVVAFAGKLLDRDAVCQP
jgi:hypothetical protein